MQHVVMQIPQSSEGKAWYSYVDPNVTATVLEGGHCVMMMMMMMTMVVILTVSKNDPPQLTETLNRF